VDGTTEKLYRLSGQIGLRVSTNPILEDSAMRSIGGSLAVILAALGMASSTFAADCKPLIKGMDAYEHGMKDALNDEPEDLPKELRRFKKALASGDTAQADRIQKKIRRAPGSLRSKKAPPALRTLHADMIEYYEAGVAVLDATSRDDKDARRAAEIETWIGLRKYFTNIRDVFVEFRCNEGDVEAIEANYFPMLDAEIDALRSAVAAPESPR
jgi:hypothetical protein